MTLLMKEFNEWDLKKGHHAIPSTSKMACTAPMYSPIRMFSSLPENIFQSEDDVNDYESQTADSPTQLNVKYIPQGNMEDDSNLERVYQQEGNPCVSQCDEPCKQFVQPEVMQIPVSFLNSL